MSILGLSISLAIAFLTGLGLVGFMVIAGLVDVPVARSTHKDITPKSGGLGIIGGVGAFYLAASFLLPSLPEPLPIGPILSLLFAMGLMGMVDDMASLGPRLKFIIMVILSAAIIWAVGPVTILPLGDHGQILPPPFAIAGTLLWLVFVTNAVNFMDGSNGMMGSLMTLAFFALLGVALIVGAPQTAAFCACFCAAILGFLPYNLRRNAQIFAGDVGALFVGFGFAVAVIMLNSEVPDARALYAGPLLILPILTDVIWTLLRRLRQGETLWLAHNTHLFQRLIRHGMGQLSVAWIYGLAGLAVANLAVFSAQAGWLPNLVIVLGPAAVLSVIYWGVSVRLPD